MKKAANKSAKAEKKQKVTFKKIAVIAIVIVIIVGMLITLMPAVAFGEMKSDDIVVLYTGNLNGEVSENIGLAGVAAYMREVKESDKYVELVDCGNALGGTVLDATSEGRYMTEAMNLAGYTICVPGTGEFRYGVTNLLKNIKPLAGYSMISANLMKTDGSRAADAFKIVTYGNTMVAYVGVSSPETATKKELSKNLSGPSGLKEYNLSEGLSGASLCTNLQTVINAAKMVGADYIVAIGNLNENSSVYSPEKIIAGTSGINVFLNASQSASAGVKVKDKSGAEVLLASPGKELGRIGVLRLSQYGLTISNTLVSSYPYRDINTTVGLESIETFYSKALANTFAQSGSLLRAVDSKGMRIVENAETNLGDLTADAYRNVTGADIAFAAASELKKNIPSGDISYRDVMAAVPSKDKISVVKMSGCDILDALEMSVRKYPDRNSEFLQVSGITFDIDETVISSVKTDADGNFVSVRDIAKVSNVMVNGKELDPLGDYLVAGTDSLLNGETGYTMFEKGRLTDIDVADGSQAVIEYISGKLGGRTGAAYAQPQLRMDVVRLARRSDIEAEVEKLTAARVAEYEKKIAELEAQIRELKQTVTLDDLEITATGSYYKKSGKRRVKLAWTTSEEISGVSYQIYRSVKGSGTYKKMFTTTKKSYLNTASLTQGTTYLYKVRAYKYIDGVYRYSPWSNVVSKKITS